MEVNVDKTKPEIWKTVKVEGLENYQVSSQGRMRNKTTKLILKYFITGFSQYCRINLYNRKKGYQIRYTVHILIAKTFLKPPKNPEQKFVNHIDGVKTNNVPSNLEWCTAGENLSHAFRTGLRNQDGVKNHNAKHTEAEIRQICELLQEGTDVTDIVRKVFNYEPKAIRQDDKSRKLRALVWEIKRRKKWKSISKDYEW